MNPSIFSVYNASAGSGKTFTLVKEYLKILLTSDSAYSFQNILAITFTNKAANEMKERVLKNLQIFAEAEENAMFLQLCSETQIEKRKLHLRSKKVLHNILQNYSAFNITTIDSFTYKLIRTFAYDLGIPLNFEVEMDGTQLLKEAVDVLISKIGTTKKLTEVLIDFSIQKVKEDKSWDISRELNAIAKILLNEADISQIKKLEQKSLDDFKHLEKKLKNYKRKIAEKFINIGKEGCAIIDALNIEHNNFLYAELPKHFVKLIDFKKQRIGNIKFEGRLYKNLLKGALYTKSRSQEVKNAIDLVADKLIQLYFDSEQLYNEYYSSYVLVEMVSKSLIPLAALNNIQKELSSIKDQNNIRLNAEFNQLISEKIKREPAPFIYERIGEKFKHFFIDEMQDTSLMQWENLIPLINNALSQEGGSLLLVGDAKQAIYRWRGGKAKQFIDLSTEGSTFKNNPFLIPKKTKNLKVNYRSFSEIIEFNNSFFTHIASFLSKPIHKEIYKTGNQQIVNAKKGGFVQLNFIAKKDLDQEERKLAYPKKVLEIVQQLDVNFKKGDICVLVRRKKDGVAVANYLSENQIEIVSSETLLLKNSSKVNFLVDFLFFITYPRSKNFKFKILSFLVDFFEIEKEPHLFFQEFIDLEIGDFFNELQSYGIQFQLERFLRMPFYERIEELIRSFRLLPKTDAYVQSFLDFVLDFQRTNAKNIPAFLELWDEKKEKLSISAVESDDAVKIMTIHKAKGLEFPVVIFPCDLKINSEIEPTIWYDNLDPIMFDNFKTSLISCTSSIKLTGTKGTQLFEKRKEEVALDHYNLLYVALTRAVEQLYIVTDYKTDRNLENPSTFSGMFINYLKSGFDEPRWNPGTLTYGFGSKKRDLPPLENREKPKTQLQENFISTPWVSHDIKIISKASKNWGTDQDTAIQYGLLIHEMLSKIITIKDVKPVLKSYTIEGIISKAAAKLILKLLTNLLNHRKISPYFQENQIVFNERAILNKEGQLLIPDRLIFKGKDVQVIDYKTGKPSQSHKNQLNSYALTLEEMGFKIIGKILIYIGEVPTIKVF